jgi:hypothetical protein
MTTAGTDESEHKNVSVFSKYLFVNAVMDFVALSIAIFRSSSVISSLFAIVKNLVVQVLCCVTRI